MANPKKTTFLLLNTKELNQEFKIGNVQVKQDTNSKLLGMPIDSNQKWNSHFNSVTAALNKRHFFIKRLKNHINRCSLKIVAHSLWLGEARYGLQLCGKVRLQSSDPVNQNVHTMQIQQNKLKRSILDKKYGDQTSASVMLEELGFLSINQINAQIKILEVWKSLKIKEYSIKF